MASPSTTSCSVDAGQQKDLWEDSERPERSVFDSDRVTSRAQLVTSEERFGVFQAGLKSVFNEVSSVPF